jgi:hypothetical protein
MTPLEPPRLAVRLLHRFGPADEALVGDLFEEFDRRRSAAWFWRQVLGALVVTNWRRNGSVEIRPLRLVEERMTPLRTLSGPLQPLYRIDAVNLSGAPIRGFGGLAIVFIVVLSAMTQPGISILATTGVVLGVALGWLFVARGRRRHWTEPSSLSHIFDHA